MSACDLMARLLEMDIELHVDGDELVLRHYDVLDDAVVNAIRANKPALIAMLTAGDDERDGAGHSPQSTLSDSTSRVTAPAERWRRLTDARVAAELGLTHRFCPACDERRPAPLDGLCFRCDPETYR